MGHTFKFTTISGEGVKIETFDGSTLLTQQEVTGGGMTKFLTIIENGVIVALTISCPEAEFVAKYELSGNTFIVDNVTITGTGQTLIDNFKAVARPAFPNAGTSALTTEQINTLYGYTPANSATVYQTQVVADEPAAVAAATGTQKKLITTSDTGDKYYYEGTEGVISNAATRKKYITPKLTRWQYKLANDPTNCRMGFSGDSTSILGTTFLDEITKRTLPGDILAGFDMNTLVDYSSNGDSIANFYGTPAGANHLNAIIAAQLDLLIFAWGINDIRQNNLTKDQLKAYIINSINAIRVGSPNTEIILRIPNPFLSVSPNGYIVQGSYGTLALAAQAQSNILYTAYKELEGYWDNVVLWDSRAEVFGNTALASSPIMLDEIHPNPRYFLPPLLNVIGYKEPFSERKAIDALYDNNGAAASTYATPWTVYPRVLEFQKNFKKIAEGRLNSQTSTSILFNPTPFEGTKDAYDAAAQILPGDIINVGDTVFLKIPAGVGITVSTKTLISLLTLGTVPTNTLAAYTPIAIYRSIYNHNYATEQYINDTKNYPYRRRINISGGSNFLNINAIYDRNDGITKNDSILLLAEQLQLQLTDTIVTSNGTTITSFSSFSSNTNLVAFKSGDFSAFSSETCYIFGNHAYENSFPRTNTATGTTGAQTINTHRGTVNIAAAGTSLTVTNRLAKAASQIKAMVMTNDANKTKVYAVVPTQGQFTIYVDPAPAAEIKICFEVAD